MEIGVLKHVIRSSTDGKQVWRNYWSLVEYKYCWIALTNILVKPADVMFFNNALARLNLSFSTIWDCHPVICTHHNKWHLGLKAWLVEAREDFFCIVCFKVSIHVLLVITLIDVSVEPDLISIVATNPSHVYGIPTFYKIFCLQIDFLVLVTLIFWGRLWRIYHKLTDCHSPQIKKELSFSRQLF